MNIRLLCIATLVFSSGCSTTSNSSADLKPSAPTGDEISYAVVRFSVLQSLNINDTKSVREFHEMWLAGDIRSLWARVQPESLFTLSTQDRARAMRALRSLAVLNERHPVTAWNSDPEITMILKAAVADDLKQTAELRARDWSKSWLGPNAGQAAAQ